MRRFEHSPLSTGLITGYARNVATFNSHQSAYILCYLLVCKRLARLSKNLPSALLNCSRCQKTLQMRYNYVELLAIQGASIQKFSGFSTGPNPDKALRKINNYFSFVLSKNRRFYQFWHRKVAVFSFVCNNRQSYFSHSKFRATHS